MFLGDFHMHSTFSDGKLSIPELVDLHGRLGFGAIAITDHLCESRSVIGRAAGYIGHTLTPATFPLYLAILRSEADRAWREYRMVLIPGVEFTKNTVSNHRSAHILALGIDRYLSADPDALDIIRTIHAQGALAVAAHPVSTRKVEKQTFHLWSRRAELASEFDAWEVASGPYLFDEVAASGLPMIANSDLHRPAQIESWKTLFDCERKLEPILRAIQRQEIRFKYLDEVILDDLCRLNRLTGLGSRDLLDANGDLVDAQTL